MFDEPQEQPAEQAVDPKDRAREKSDEFRLHAELVAVFEGVRKFDAQIRPKMDAALTREIQRTMGKLEKARSPEHPVLPEKAWPEARELLGMPRRRAMSTNDYHIHRRPGEVIIVRWLEGQEVESFYERFQAHFDVALAQFREEERQSKQWKQDPATLKYLDALDAIDIKLAERYLRQFIQQHRLFVLSTQAADEIDILYLCDYIMSIEASDVVGEASAPPEEPTEQDRAWFFKLFSLRGMTEGVEQMCFFTYLQKTDDAGYD